MSCSLATFFPADGTQSKHRMDSATVMTGRSETWKDGVMKGFWEGTCLCRGRLCT